MLSLSDLRRDACFEWCTPLVNGYVSDVLLNAAVQVVSRHCRKILQ